MILGEVSSPAGHQPVLLDPILGLLAPRPGQTFLDCTVGRGGHSAAFAERLGPSGVVVGVDLDEGNLRFAQERVAAVGGARFVPLHGSFAEAPARLVELGLVADLVLADLGFASTQVDDPSRGLSFSAEGPLDMRYDRSKGRTAAELLATLSERELADTIRMLGEDPLAARIARKTAQERRRAPIQTTTQLANLVKEVYGPRAHRSRLHPATRTFMALRIAVNDELNSLAGFLRQVREQAERTDGHGSQGRGGRWLSSSGKVAVIAFHGLEDRPVKHAFADLERSGLATRLTRKPVTPDERELAANPRARSAKLRVLQLGAPPAKRRRYGAAEHGERAFDGLEAERPDEGRERGPQVKGEK